MLVNTLQLPRPNFGSVGDTRRLTELPLGTTCPYMICLQVALSEDRLGKATEIEALARGASVPTGQRRGGFHHCGFVLEKFWNNKYLLYQLRERLPSRKKLASNMDRVRDSSKAASSVVKRLGSAGGRDNGTIGLH